MERDQAYRGYLIRHNPINELCWIETAGQHIGYAKDTEAAKATIDELVNQ